MVGLKVFFMFIDSLCFDRPSEPKAAIGFIYDDGDIVAGKQPLPPQPRQGNAEEESEPSEVDSDADIGAPSVFL